MKIMENIVFVNMWKFKKNSSPQCNILMLSSWFNQDTEDGSPWVKRNPVKKPKYKRVSIYCIGRDLTK